MVQFFRSGGIFMIPLIICSLVTVAVILERGFTLMRRRVISHRLASAIDQLQPGQDIDIIVKVAHQDKTTLAEIVKVALDHLQWPKTENIEAVQTRARKMTTELDRGIVVLEILTGVAPLLGLLGTVSGLITMFAELSTGKVQAQSQALFLSKGISEALNCTVMGLVVAIPALIAYSYFSKKVETLAIEMEAIVSDLVAKLYRSGVEEIAEEYDEATEAADTDSDDESDEKPEPPKSKKK